MQELRVCSLGQKDPWSRKWQPTPIFLPEKSHGQRSLVGYSPKGCKESDRTEQQSMHIAYLQHWVSFRYAAVVYINNSVIHIFIFQILLPYRILQNIQYNSLWYIVAPYWLSILYIVRCIWYSQFTHPPSFSLW